MAQRSSERWPFLTGGRVGGVKTTTFSPFHPFSIHSTWTARSRQAHFPEHSHTHCLLFYSADAGWVTITTITFFVPQQATAAPLVLNSAIKLSVSPAAHFRFVWERKPQTVSYLHLPCTLSVLNMRWVTTLITRIIISQVRDYEAAPLSYTSFPPSLILLSPAIFSSFTQSPVLPSTNGPVTVSHSRSSSHRNSDCPRSPPDNRLTFTRIYNHRPWRIWCFQHMRRITIKPQTWARCDNGCHWARTTTTCFCGSKRLPTDSRIGRGSQAARTTTTTVALPENHKWENGKGQTDMQQQQAE